MLETIIFQKPLLLHIAVALFAIVVWCYRDVRFGFVSVAADIIGVISIPFVIEIYLYFVALVEPDKYGTQAGWFVFFSMISWGLLPLITAAFYWFFGRGIGRVIRVIHKKLF